MLKVALQYFLLALLSGLGVTASYAQEVDNIFVRCNNKVQKNTVQIRTKWNDFSVDNSIPSRKLNNRASRTPIGDFIVGLTSLTTVTEIDFNGELNKDKSGKGECLAPNVQITITLEPIQVYIGSEFKPDSCAYKTIHEHEMRHVELYKNSIPKVAALVQDLLRRRLGERPIYAPVGGAYRLLRQEIDLFWRPLIKAELSKIEIDQQALDSESELSELAYSCNGSIQQRFGLRFGTDALDVL